jgi:hypothetical protein
VHCGICQGNRRGLRSFWQSTAAELENLTKQVFMCSIAVPGYLSGTAMLFGTLETINHQHSWWNKELIAIKSLPR